MASSSLLLPSDYIQIFANRQCRFRKPYQAREALDKMNGFNLAGRPIRIGLGKKRFSFESTASFLEKFQQQFQFSAFSRASRRGPQASSSGSCANDKNAGGSTLDDTDVAGVNLNNYSPDVLMKKLATTDDEPTANGHNDRREDLKPKTGTKPLPVNVNIASRCVVLKNMFDPAK
jgi:RNA-binding protein 23/39